MLSVGFYVKCFCAEDTALSCRHQITVDLKNRLDLGKEESSQTYVLDSHKHTLKTHTDAVLNSMPMVVLSVSGFTLLVVIIVRSVTHCNSTTLSLFLAAVAEAQSRRPSPPTDSQTGPPVHLLRLAGG